MPYSPMSVPGLITPYMLVRRKTSKPILSDFQSNVHDWSSSALILNIIYVMMTKGKMYLTHFDEIAMISAFSSQNLVDRGTETDVNMRDCHLARVSGTTEGGCMSSATSAVRAHAKLWLTSTDTNCRLLWIIVVCTGNKFTEKRHRELTGDVT